MPFTSQISTPQPKRMFVQTSQLEKWRNRNLYYYRDLEKLCQFLIQPGSKVLELGSGLGYLLEAVHPAYGLGVDISEFAVEKSRERFPNLEFLIEDAEEIRLDQIFDYIILANTISYIQNVQRALQNMQKCCHPSTQVILTYHNPAWEPILNLATSIGQRMPLPDLNWLSFEDVENLLNLSGFEVVYHGKRLLFPKRLPIASWFFNRVLAPLPLLNRLCLNEYVIARPQPGNASFQAQVQTLTCSVIVPARNEAGNIENAILRMPRLGRHTEIIFIEGHSKDGTWDEIQRVQAKYADRWDIKIAQQTGKGKGNAVRQGFEMATGDVFIILDSDLTVRPEDLTYFFEAIASGYCEMANGCRLIYPVSKIEMPLLNRMANRFFAWLLSYLLNTRIKDSLCGTKAISRQNYARLAANRSYFGDFDPFGDFDLLLGASKLGLKIKDIPVRYVPREYGSSNIQHFKEGLNLLKMCLHAARKIKFS
ncbi:MAG: glycosyltransferase [Oscillatoriophycideae cyanobacterium NC_groundwater_1537_Pr4_S-0.65um_50_18]|nr:glycosyltransferase [Oscillatoriophycideae cyanobacterium NC_groundwater_1537_Pr4_S-0.65um_50_18]